MYITHKVHAIVIKEERQKEEKGKIVNRQM